MRNFGVAAVLGAIAVFLAGCSVTIGGAGRPAGEYPSVRSDAGTLAEIDSAAKLTFNDDKEKAFIGIASREYLSGRAQAHLAKTAVRSLTFDDSKRDVLLALVNNPYFVAEGKQAVLESLDVLAFESSKTKVLEAIGRRGVVPTERELQRRLERHPHPMQETEEGAIQMETTVEMRAEYVEGL